MIRGIALQRLIFLALVSSLLLTVSALSCAQETPTPSTTTEISGPKYGGTLRITISTETDNLGYPPKMPRVHYMQSAPALEPLLRMDKAGKLVPWLASGYTTDVATKSITLTIRKGVRFHDGTDLNADAVKWNLEQSILAKSLGVAKYKSVDVIDNYTLRINLKEWDNTVIGSLNTFTGIMISPTAYKKNGEEWCIKNPVGTGPFQFVSWEKGVRVTYKRFDGYWQKDKPYLDGVEFVFITEPVTSLLSFRSGEVDTLWNAAATDSVALEKEGYIVTTTPQGTLGISLISDSANPNSPFANVKVRQAVSYALDMQTMINSLMQGKNEYVNQPIYKAHWGYNPSVIGYPYNPAKAKQLLTEAGFPNGFKTKLLYVSVFEYNQVYTSVQSYLKIVGIDAALDPAPQPRHTQTAIGGKWEGLIHCGPTGETDIAASITARLSGIGGWFTQMLLPDDYVQAVRNSVTAPDFETKQKYTHDAMKLMIDKYCLLNPLFFGTYFIINQKYVRNSGFNESLNNAWWTPEDAWLDKK